jgi:hypothetical protein
VKESTGRCSRIVHHKRAVKGWHAELPSPEAARSSAWTGGDALSRPMAAVIAVIAVIAAAIWECIR